MQQEDRLATVKALMQGRAGVPGAPSVEPIEPHIRSGATFLFRDPLKRGVPSDEQDVVRRLIDDKHYVGTICSIWGYNVLPERAQEFRRWLLVNEPRLVQATPPGVFYKGTYAVWISTEKEAGEYRTVWSYASLQAIQDLSEAAADQGSTFAQLLGELVGFQDRRPGAPRSQEHWQPASTAHRF